MTVDQPPHHLRYDSGGVVAGFARGEWQFQFLSDQSGVTFVREKPHIPLGDPGRLILAMAGNFPDSEVRHNPRPDEDIARTIPAADEGTAIVTAMPIHWFDFICPFC